MICQHPGAQGEGDSTGRDLSRPRGYEVSAGRVRPSLSSIHSTPNLVGQYHYHRFVASICIASFPPRGQLHTAVPSVRNTGEAWGGGVTSLFLGDLLHFSTHASLCVNLEIVVAHHSHDPPRAGVILMARS